MNSTDRFISITRAAHEQVLAYITSDYARDDMVRFYRNTLADIAVSIIAVGLHMHEIYRECMYLMHECDLVTGDGR